jgi:hypothetical protein
LPSAILNTIQFSQQPYPYGLVPFSSVYGLITVSNDINGNTITGSLTQANTPPQTGVYHFGSPYNSFIFQNNTLSNLKNGIRIVNQDYPSTDAGSSIRNNNFTNNLISVGFEQNPFSLVTKDKMGVTCNSFANPANFNQPFGIYVAQGALLQSLGDALHPNGNNFSLFQGSAKQIQYEGSQTGFSSFAYFKYLGSNQEKGFVTGPFGTKILTPGKISANSGTCLPNKNGTGVTARIAAIGNGANIQAMKDSLRLMNGTFFDMKDYQSSIANYHISSNSVSSLESYTDSLLNQNQEAYNTLSLTIMEYYRQNGNEIKAQNRKNILLANNLADQEIVNRAKYFDVTGRIGKDTLWFIGRLAQTDSTDLASIAASGTSTSEIACIILSSMYPENPCSGFIQNLQTIERNTDSLITVASGNPEEARLGQSVPNPAAEQTSISYQLTKDAKAASITINDLVMMGRKVSEFNLNADIKNASLTVNLSTYATGVYSYSLIIDGVLIDTKKMVVIK